MKCDTTGCETKATFYQARIESRHIAFDKRLCERHAEAFFIDFRSSVVVGTGVQRAMVAAVCVDVELVSYYSLRRDTSSPACIYLHEVGGARRMCMVLDSWAWFAMITQLKHESAPRPHTHTAWAATITELGGKLQDLILDMRDGEKWWSAKARIVKDDRLVTVDVRASDACIMALTQHDVPIFVPEKTLEKFADKGEGLSGN